MLNYHDIERCISHAFKNESMEFHVQKEIILAAYKELEIIRQKFSDLESTITKLDNEIESKTSIIRELETRMFEMRQKLKIYSLIK